MRDGLVSIGWTKRIKYYLKDSLLETGSVTPQDGGPLMNPSRGKDSQPSNSI